MQYYNPNLIISTFFGVGFLSKKFPGTIGSIVGIPVGYGLFQLSYMINTYLSLDELSTVFLPLIFITVFLWILGGYAAHKYSRATGKLDPKEVVIDEVLGQALVLMVTVPITLALIQEASRNREIIFSFDPVIACVVVSFVLFRIFDIVKPWPIRWVDKKLKIGAGIMLDDLLAAVFAIVVYLAIALSAVDRF